MTSAVNEVLFEFVEDIAYRAQLLQTQKFRGVSKEEQHELLRMVAQGYSDDALEMHPVFQRLAIHEKDIAQTHGDILEYLVLHERPLPQVPQVPQVAVTAAPFAGVDESQESELFTQIQNLSDDFQIDFTANKYNVFNDEEMAQFFRAHFAENVKRNVLVLLLTAFSRRVDIEVIKIVACVYQVGIFSYLFDSVRGRKLGGGIAPKNINKIVHSVEGQIFWRKWAAAYGSVYFLDFFYEDFPGRVIKRVNDLVRDNALRYVSNIIQQYAINSGAVGTVSLVGGMVGKKIPGVQFLGDFVGPFWKQITDASNETIGKGFSAIEGAIRALVRYVEEDITKSVETRSALRDALTSLRTLVVSIRLCLFGIEHETDSDIASEAVKNQLKIPKIERTIKSIAFMFKLYFIWGAKPTGTALATSGALFGTGEDNGFAKKYLYKRLDPNKMSTEDVETYRNYNGKEMLKKDDNNKWQWTDVAVEIFTYGTVAVYKNQDKYAKMSVREKFWESMNELVKTFNVIDLSVMKFNSDILTAILQLLMSKLPKSWKSRNCCIVTALLLLVVNYVYRRAKLFAQNVRTGEEAEPISFKEWASYVWDKWWYTPDSNELDVHSATPDEEANVLKDEYLRKNYPKLYENEYVLAFGQGYEVSIESGVSQLIMQFVVWGLMGGIQTCASSFNDKCKGWIYTFVPNVLLGADSAMIPLGCYSQSDTTEWFATQETYSNTREYHFICKICETHIKNCKSGEDDEGFNKANEKGNVLQFTKNQEGCGFLCALTCALCSNQQLSKTIKTRRQTIVNRIKKQTDSTNSRLDKYVGEIRVLCQLTEQIDEIDPSRPNLAVVQQNTYTPTLFGLWSCDPMSAYLAMINQNKMQQEPLNISIPDGVLSTIPDVFYSYFVWFKFLQYVDAQLSYSLHLEIYLGTSMRNQYETYDKLVFRCMEELSSLLEKKRIKPNIFDVDVIEHFVKTIDNFNPREYKNMSPVQQMDTNLTKLNNILILKRLFTPSDLMGIAKPSLWRQTSNVLNQGLRKSVAFMRRKQTGRPTPDEIKKKV